MTSAASTTKGLGLSGAQNFGTTSRVACPSGVLLNPFGSLDHGFEQVAERMERVASQVSDGEVTSFDVVEKYVTPELAYVVWVERSKAKAGGRQEVLPFDLRVTLIL